jgi:hypothetical protein
VHAPSLERMMNEKTVLMTNKSRLLIIFLSTSTIGKFFWILMQNWEEDSFRSKIGNDSLHQDNNE